MPPHHGLSRALGDGTAHDHADLDYRLVRSLVFAATYAVLVWAGRLTHMADTHLAMVWPAAGAGLLWLRGSLGDRRRFAVDALALWALAAMLNILTGFGWAAGSWFGLVNAAQAMIGVALVSRLLNSELDLRTPVDLGWLMVACLASCTTAALLAAPVLWALGLRAPVDLGLEVVAWISRNTTGSVLVAAIGARFANGRVLPELERDAVRRDLVPFLAVFVLSLIGMVGGLALPVALAVVPALALAAIRFSTSLSSILTLVAGLAMVVQSMLGHGPFAAMPPRQQAFMVQGTVAVITGLTLMLAAFRDQRDALLARLEIARTDAVSRMAMIAESERLYRVAFERAPLGILLLGMSPDTAGVVVSMNDEVPQILGSNRVLNTNFTLLVHPQDRQAFVAQSHAVVNDEPGEPSVEIRLRHESGDFVFCRVSSAVVKPVPGEAPFTMLMIEDVTAQRRARDLLQFQALHDPLTGLANRILFSDRLDHALAASKRSLLSVGVLYIDLDGFKTVNDVSGHAAGDQVLTTVAERISEIIRPGDTFARLGGDEFALLCPETLRGGLVVVANRILDVLAEPILIGGHPVAITGSIGAAVSSVGALSGKDLLRLADSAMYQAKRAGKSRVVFDEGVPLPRSR